MMTIKIPHCSLSPSLFVAALLIGAAPAAYAQCEAGAGGSMIEDMAKTQESAGAETGATAEQSGTATAESDIETDQGGVTTDERSEEHTSELQPLMSISYAVCCLKKKKK